METKSSHPFSFLGEFVVDPEGKKHRVSEVCGHGVVALYFSAHWCFPCRTFTPYLIELYKECKSLKKPFEVIFVSSDKSDDEFNEYFQEMPWKAVPYNKKLLDAIGERFDIQGIPSLLLFDKKGALYNTKGRIYVTEGVGAYPWAPPDLIPLKRIRAYWDDSKVLMVLAPRASEHEVALLESELTTLVKEKSKTDPKLVGCLVTGNEPASVVQHWYKEFGLNASTATTPYFVWHYLWEEQFFVEPIKQVQKGSVNTFYDDATKNKLKKHDPSALSNKSEEEDDDSSAGSTILVALGIAAVVAAIAFWSTRK